MARPGYVPRPHTHHRELLPCLFRGELLVRSFISAGRAALFPTPPGVKVSHFPICAATPTVQDGVIGLTPEPPRSNRPRVIMSEESNKSALAFILNPTESHAAATPTLSPSRKPGSSSSSGDEDSMLTSEEEDEELRLRHLSIQGRSLLSETEIVEKQVSRLLALDSHHNGKMRMRKSAICSHDDCGRAAVSRGRCVRHGGGSRCTFPNCTHGARLYNRCFHHGGCKICKVEGCTSKAKRYGYCWSHGGGHICDAPGCTKVAAPGGFCWAHGGGNRCRMEGCNRRSYQKHDYYCKQHTSVGGSSA